MPRSRHSSASSFSSDDPRSSRYGRGRRRRSSSSSDRRSSRQKDRKSGRKRASRSRDSSPPRRYSRQQHSPEPSHSSRRPLRNRDTPPQISQQLRDRFFNLTEPDVQGPLERGINAKHVPLFDEFIGDLLSRQEQTTKFYADIAEGDRIAAEIRSTSAIMLELELLCTTNRFKRLLEPLKLGRFKVMHDRSEFHYRSGDIVEVVVTAKFDENDPQSKQQRLALNVVKADAPLQSSQMPFYYRMAMKRIRQAERASRSSSPVPVASTSFEERPDIRSIAHNPNAPYAYGFPRRIPDSCIPSLHARRPLKPPEETAETLRDLQLAQQAEQQIRKAGDYIRNGQNFEAIQCCNQALNLIPDNTDALLGRAIAANNMENFASAVIDLDKILELEPNNSRTRSIIDKVLVQQAEKFEETGNYVSARRSYTRASEEFGSKDAAAALLRIGSSSSGKRSKNGRGDDVIDLTSDDEHDGRRSSRGNGNVASSSSQRDIVETEERRRRLRELESFKASLAKRVKR